MTHPLEESIMDITEAVEELRDIAKRDKPQIVVKAPDVKVAAPNVTVSAPPASPAPQVTVNVPPSPSKWVAEITRRDNDGKVKEITFTAK